MLHEKRKDQYVFYRSSSPSMDQLVREIYMESSPEPESLEVDRIDLISSLTDECLLCIFVYLNHITLCHCGMVCKRWYAITSDKTLWKSVNFGPLGVNITDDSFQKLVSKKMKSTQNVYLGSLRVSFKILKHLTHYCKQLSTIVFGRGSTIEDFNETDRRLSKVIPRKLQTLDMRLGAGDFEFLLDNELLLTDILNLGIGSHSFSTIGLNILFTKFPYLQTLDFTNCHQIDDLSIEEMAKNCTNLRSLCLIGCKHVYGTSFNILISKCRSLKTLLLRYLKLEDDVISQDLWQESVIEELDISACPRITSSGLQRFLVQLQHLIYLNISYCGEGSAVNDSVLHAITDAGCMRNLRMLDLRWSFDITSKILGHFLRTTSQLKYLGIYQSFNVLSFNISEYIHFVPQLKILEFGSAYREELSESNLIPKIILNSKYIQTLSLINFAATQTNLSYKYVKTLLKKCKQLHRINLCDCSHDLIKICRQAVKNTITHVKVTVKWECALPPPTNTLDAIIST